MHCSDFGNGTPSSLLPSELEAALGHALICRRQAAVISTGSA